MARRSWDHASIDTEVLKIAEKFGRMPSANELRASGANDLACAIPRYGGYFQTATRLNLRLKGTETHRGQTWERSEAEFFRGLGHTVVHQSTRAPFDLLVGEKRVDVKMGNRRTTVIDGRPWSAYFFGGLHDGEGCDLFDLVCVEDGVVRHRFIIPSEHAKVLDLTISESSISGKGKYNKFLNALDLLK